MANDDEDRPRKTEPDIEAPPARSTEPDIEAPPARSTMDDLPRGGTIPMGEIRAATPGEQPAQADADDDLEHEDATADAPPDVEASNTKKPKPVLYIVLGLVLFSALAGPILFYFFVWRYKPTAPQHIPAGTVIAVRMDAKELYLFEPFRKNVLGVLDDQPGVKSRAARLKKSTGIDPRSDLREIVVASPDGHRFVVLLGGYFTQARMNRASVTKGLLDFLTEEGVTGFSLEGDVLVGPGGLEIAQADDATVIIASDDEMLRASREPSDDWMKLGLVSSGALSFAIDGPVFAHAAKDLSSFGDTSVLAHTTRATGFMKLGYRPELSAELIPEGVDSEELSKETEALLSNARLLTALFPDVFGEKAALAAAHAKPRTSSVLVTAPWPVEGLEAGTKWLGESGRALLEHK